MCATRCIRTPFESIKRIDPPPKLRCIHALSLSLFAATEAFHRISIIILAHGTFYTSVRVIMCDGRAAAIERGINNHLITPGQLMLARRINMREGELGIYASTSGEKGGRGVKVWSNVLNELDGYSGTAILNVRPFLNIYSMFPEEGGISYAMHHHSHASTIMSSFRIILALINEPRPWTRTRGTRREWEREWAVKWTRIEFGNGNVGSVHRLFTILRRYTFVIRHLFHFFIIFGLSILEETFLFCKSFHFRGS